MAEHRTPIFTCSSSRRRNWRTSSPSSVSFLELPPTRRRHWPRRRSLTIHPLIDDLCPPEPNRAQNHRHRPARGTATPASFTVAPNPHADKKHRQNFSFSSLTRFHRYCWRFPFRLLLRGGLEQFAKTLGLGGTIFNIRVVGGEVC